MIDALRWVMGEQNPRHLRGRDMEDLIFAGTEKKPAVGMCEVILTLDNSDGLAAPPYGASPRSRSRAGSTARVRAST